MRTLTKQKINLRVRFLWCALLALGLGGVVLHQLDNSRSTPATAQWFAMDTRISITVYDAGKEGVLADLTDVFAHLEQLWSVTKPSSDIYAINHSGGQKVMVHEETAELLAFALQMAEMTDGALEPTIYPLLAAWGFTTSENGVPSAATITALLDSVDYRAVDLQGSSVRLAEGMMLDLGAVGKGYAGDKAVQLLKERGIHSALIDIGGNIQAIGTKPDGSPWRLGLRNPLADDRLGVFAISDAAAVTSGNYERYVIGEDGQRYGHILDPATGYPAEKDLASVTVISSEGRLSDALSTALFVKGLDETINYWRRQKNFQMILVTNSGEIYLTEDIAATFTLDSRYKDKKVWVINDE